MFIKQLSPRWHRFHQQNINQATVLVVSFGNSLNTALAQELQKQKFRFILLTSLSDTRRYLKNNTPSLLVVHGVSEGSEMIQSLKEDNSSVQKIPSMLFFKIANQHSKSIIQKVSPDYAVKPYLSPAHLVKKIRSILEQTMSDKLFDMISNDLSKTTLSGTQKPKSFNSLGQPLLAIRQKISEQSVFYILDDNKKRKESRKQLCNAAGIIVHDLPDENPMDTLRSIKRPLVIALALESEASVVQIKELAKMQAFHRIIAIDQKTNRALAEQTILAGASEYIDLANNDFDHCAQIIRQSIHQVRKHAMHLKVVELFHHVAKETYPDLESDVIFSP